MEIDSAPGSSSRFTLRRPACSPTEPPAAAAAPLPAGSEPAAKTRRTQEKARSYGC